ncbi:MAG: cell division protein FtsA [Sulfitobacter sp.]
MNDLYESQRSMRHMRKIAMQRGVVAILDVGSSKIACLVLRFDGGDALTDEGVIGSLAGQSGFRVIGAATTRSRGVKFGEIDAMNETERAIRTALQAAQKMAGIRVDHVIACFSGAEPRSYGLDAQIDLDGETVTEHDVARVLAECDVPDYGEGREVLHAQPVNFALDHRSGLSDPRGQLGQTLSVDMHMLTVDAAAVRHLAHCIKRCDLELAGIASSSYASGISALVEDEQELGAACIDMGGGATGVSIFIKKHMIYADTVRMGGDHVTQDISLGLQVPTANAERIKTFYGGVHATGMDDREMIEIGGDTGDYEHDRRTASRAELIGIMRPRVEEILEEVRVRLDAAGFDHLPSQQIVLTGGASQIPGLDGLASKILGQQVRLGRPLRVHGLPQAATGPSFASAVGLSLFAAHPQDEWWDFDIPADKYPSRSLKRAVKWFKDNW